MSRIYSYSYSVFIFETNILVFVFGGQNTIRSPLLCTYEGNIHARKLGNTKLTFGQILVKVKNKLDVIEVWLVDGWLDGWDGLEISALGDL